MPSDFRILCAGDIHLGRRPSRVPRHSDVLSVEHVWSQFVEQALHRAVDAVVLTGDVVDEENKMYEAFGALERGLRRLLDAEIDVVAVAGNHDYDAFPRLVRSIDDDRFHLLGQGGTWETVIIENGDGENVRFVGWSFPSPHVPRSPLKDGDIEAASMQTIGVLHCDAGRMEGRYAPVGRDVLARAPVDAWLLGHIHAPNPHRQGDQLQLYTGSLQPLDPGERDTHGAWAITIDASSVTTELVPLATLRYDTVSVDVSGYKTPDEIENAVLETLVDGVAHAGTTWPNLRHVVYRLVYEGRTLLHNEIEDQARAIVANISRSSGEVEATIDDYDVLTRPDYDLEDLARGDDPAGVLAQLLLDLEADRDTNAVREMLQAARKNTQSLYEASRYEPLRHEPDTRGRPSEKELREWAQRQGYRLLDEIYAPDR